MKPVQSNSDLHPFVYQLLLTQVYITSIELAALPQLRRLNQQPNFIETKTMQSFNIMTILLAVILGLFLFVDLTVSTPTLNRTLEATPDSFNNPQGCVCPWEKGDNGCKIIGYPIFPIPPEWQAPGNAFDDAVSRYGT